MSRRLSALALTVALVIAGAGQTSAGVIIDAKGAPEWEVSEWINSDPGTVQSHRGRIVLVQFFQVWCPGSNRFSVPLFKRWDKLYGDRDDVLIVSIHSVFEGHDQQTPARLRQFVEKQGITHPVGIDAYDETDPRTPVTMRRFQAGGTPQVAVIDKAGALVFSHFGTFRPESVEAFIDRMLKEEDTPRPRGNKTRPAPAKTARKQKAAAKEEPDLPDVSGRYTMRIDQHSSTCGEPLPAFEVPLELSVNEDHLEARFEAAYLNQKRLKLDYDPKTGRFQFDSTVPTRDGESTVNLNLQLEGHLLFHRNPPTFDYNATLEESSDAPDDQGCTITLSGDGRRASQ